MNLRKEDILRPIAKANQVVRKGNQPGATVQKSAKLSINVRDTIAKASKVSHDTVAKVKFIRDNANEETPTGKRYKGIVRLWKMMFHRVL